MKISVEQGMMECVVASLLKSRRKKRKNIEGKQFTILFFSIFINYNNSNI